MRPNPLLGPADPLPYRPRRLLVAGTSGSGKTTLAGTISRVLDVPRFELDALHHGPDWTPRPEFADDVAALARQPRWVTEWQYTAVRELLLDAADCLVWLDLPRRVAVHRVVRRTLRRRLHREVLWNGNVEPPLRTFLDDPDHIVRWAWRTHPLTAERVAAARQRRPELVVVRLTSGREVTTWAGGPLRAAGPRTWCPGQPGPVGPNCSTRTDSAGTPMDTSRSEAAWPNEADPHT
jgi:adenylate kinase family enzyme